jgi:hypothetical protein
MTAELKVVLWFIAISIALALLLSPLAGQPASQVAQSSTRTKVSAEQAALIAKHELVPGFNRDNAIDEIGITVTLWSKGTWLVVIPNATSSASVGGMASLGDAKVTRALLLASWGNPDRVVVDPAGTGNSFLVYHQPHGDLLVWCTKDNDCSIITTVLAPAYFKQKFPAWTDAQCTAVAAGSVLLGMTPEMARNARGEPSDINRTVGSWGVHEQWVYSDTGTYLYFENGILTSWQD